VRERPTRLLGAPFKVRALGRGQHVSIFAFNMQGKVKFCNSARGYGFIVEEVSGTEFFVHHSDIAEWADLAPGEFVSFERGGRAAGFAQ
jgi:cold shock CspA family protein